MNFDNPSPIEEIIFKNKSYLLKRDDLLSKDFSGNKARKMAWLFDANLPFKSVVSHGSNQSNAMYSLSAFCKMKNLSFYYFTSHVSSYLKQNPQGNYALALKNGMQIYEVSDPQKEAKNFSTCLYIPEGVAMSEARYGFEILAKEIDKQIHEKVDIFLPSGTGASALYLQEYTKHQVYTCPCVGDREYLKKEFFSLQKDESKHPIILDPPKKFHFGKLYKQLYLIWQDLLTATHVEFDLLYDPVGWLSILSNEDKFSHKILYIHQGGIYGNLSLKPRYDKKYFKSQSNLILK